MLLLLVKAASEGGEPSDLWDLLTFHSFRDLLDDKPVFGAGIEFAVM